MDGEAELSEFVYMERLICAAIWFKTGVNYIHQPLNITSGYVICGRRHHNCFAAKMAVMDETNSLGLVARTDLACNPEIVQGFLTNTDRFVDRKEAFVIAKNAGQLLREKNNDTLFSEDIY